MKKLRDLDRKVSEADFKMLLADLTSELGDAKLIAVEMLETRSTTNLRQANYWNTRFRNARTSSPVRANHSPFARFSAKRRCQ